MKPLFSRPVSMMSQRWERTSRSAIVIFESPKTLDHSANAKLLVTADQMELELAAGLGRGQKTKFVQGQKCEVAEQIDGSSLTVGASFGNELFHQVYDIERAFVRGGLGFSTSLSTRQAIALVS